ncbi:hypothetical protein D3C72_855300 [compost metagenome]
MAITAIKAHFLIGEHGVIEEKIDIPDQVEHGFVDAARLMFGVGDDGKGFSFPVQPVSDGVAGMVEHSGSDRKAGMHIKRIAGQEVPRCDLGTTDLQRHGEPGRAHEIPEHFPGRHGAGKVAGPDGDIIGAVIKGLEIGEADNVVVMAMREEQVDVGNAFRPQGKASGMQARTRIEQKNVIAASYLDADGIPAVFSEVFT